VAAGEPPRSGSSRSPVAHVQMSRPSGRCGIAGIRWPAESSTAWVAESSWAIWHPELAAPATRMRDYPGPRSEQLRFGLATGYAFDAKLTGWKQPDDIAYGLTLSDDLGKVLENPVMALPAAPRTDIERKALVAVRWLDRAFLTGDELVALLYRFFALEALLGRKSEGLKAHGLALRQMVLAHAVTGSFPNPNATLLLYDKIRSGAVHGEEVPEVSTAIVHNVESGVRQTLGQYLTLAKDRGLSRRSRLLDVLDNHPDRGDLIAWLREYGGEPWTKYLDSLEWPQNGC
jgi:hypothetical protein